MKSNSKNSLFKTLFLESTLGVIVTNNEGQITLINKEAERLFGYEAGQLTGELIEILVPDTSRKSHLRYRDNYHQKPVRRLMGEGRELFGKKKDGSSFPVEISLTSMVVETERLAVAFIQDISVRLQTSNALRESESQLNAVIENAIEGIITVSAYGIVLSINPAGAEIFGYSQEEIIGENVKILIPEKERDIHDEYMADYRRTRKKKIIDVAREVEGRKKDGSKFPVLLGVSEIKLEKGIIFSGVIHDLTEQKQAEKKLLSSATALEKSNKELQQIQIRLKQMNQELEDKVKERTAALVESEHKLKEALASEIELNELKSRFVSMASHEFRTPLSSILSSATLIQMYKEKGVPEKQGKHIKRIQSSVNNLTSILNDFLSLEKLESGRVEANFINLSFKSFMDEVIEELQPTFREGQEIQFSHEGEDEVRVDPHLVKNILFNLLSNAIKYSPDGKDVEVKSKLENQLLQVSVKDQGIGIPKEDQKHLFSRFFRATNAANIQGTGLGLNIVKRYLDLMGGKINFTSDEQDGTTFYFEIPKAG